LEQRQDGTSLSRFLRYGASRRARRSSWRES
jgi:hypothetical protein